MQFVDNTDSDQPALSANSYNGYCSICRQTKNAHTDFTDAHAGPSMSAYDVTAFFFPRGASYGWHRLLTVVPHQIVNQL